MAVDVLWRASHGPGRQPGGAVARDVMALFDKRNERVRQCWFPSSVALFGPLRSPELSPPADAEASLDDAARLTALLLHRPIVET